MLTSPLSSLISSSLPWDIEDDSEDDEGEEERSKRCGSLLVGRHGGYTLTKGCEVDNEEDEDVVHVSTAVGSFDGAFEVLEEADGVVPGQEEEGAADNVVGNLDVLLVQLLGEWGCCGGLPQQGCLQEQK